MISILIAPTSSTEHERQQQPHVGLELIGVPGPGYRRPAWNGTSTMARAR